MAVQEQSGMALVKHCHFAGDDWQPYKHRAGVGILIYRTRGSSRYHFVMNQ